MDLVTVKNIQGIIELPMTSLQAVLPSSESIKTDRIDKADCHTDMSHVTVDCPILSVYWY